MSSSKKSTRSSDEEERGEWPDERRFEYLLAKHRRDAVGVVLKSRDEE